MLSRLYRKFDFPYSLRKLLGSAKDRSPDLSKSGIYEISCQDGCDFAYYWKTERNLVVRYSEHENCFAKNDTRSAVAKHLIENNHTTDLSKMKLLQSVSGRNTCAYECYEKIHIIKNKRKKQIMNQNDGNINSILFDLV